MMNEVVDLVPSSRVSYHFRFFQVMKSFTYYDSEDRVWQGDTHEFQGAVYSGVSHGEDAQLLRVETRTTESDLIPSFHALLPYVSTVNFFDLLPTGATESNQDTSILSVATMIVTRPTLLQPIVEAVAKVISLDR